MLVRPPASELSQRIEKKQNFDCLRRLVFTFLTFSPWTGMKFNDEPVFNNDGIFCHCYKSELIRWWIYRFKTFRFLSFLLKWFLLKWRKNFCYQLRILPLRILPLRILSLNWRKNLNLFWWLVKILTHVWGIFHNLLPIKV